MGIKIGMILDNEFDGDPRVENEVLSLQNAGHQVFVLCYNWSNKQNSKFHGAEIIRMNLNRELCKKLKGLNHTVFNFYTWLWARWIRKFVAKYEIEVLHVHDLWMVNSAIKANNSFGRRLPMYFDLHENFVYALSHYKYANRFPGKYLISKEKWKNSEPKWLRQADKIIVVIEEARDRVEKLGISGDKIEVVANYVNIDEFKKDNAQLTAKLREENKVFFTMTYTGGFDIHRGLEIAVKAVPTVLKSIPNFKFILVGGGSNKEDLKKIAKKLGVEEAVYFAGYRPFQELPSYVKSSDICIIPHLKTPHTDNTIPHKLFQYMVMNKVVIASDCAPIKRIIHETESGFIYRFDSPEECAQAIVDAYNADREAIGRKGHTAVKNKYNWNETSKNLLKLYTVDGVNR
ncbi:MAG: glycosyltransferase family 4 protein [Bacteroidota bacterium]